jgi:CheY-like chemotaxis protein
LLIAEDVQASRKLLVKLLQPLGFDVREASNGQEAVEIWERWQPHLIWMDIRMPVMDGHEATRRIKATPQGQKTVIVALTAGAFEEDRARVLSTGCDDFVRKPFREADILDVLTRHLRVRFVYQDVVSEEAEGAELTESLSLAGTPSEWRAALRQATLEGDLGWMATLIEQIRDHDPALASGLAKLADNFEHRRILSLFQEG